MTRWEYTTLSLPEGVYGLEDFEALTKFGADGWEAFAVSQREECGVLSADKYGERPVLVYHLKRPLPPSSVSPKDSKENP